MPQITPMTVTFYGDEECEVARAFAEKVIKEYGSVNNGLKELAKNYLKSKPKEIGATDGK